jgi:hypothetical protein
VLQSVRLRAASLCSRSCHIIYVPIVLSIAAIVVLWIGLPRARHSRQPPRFTIGLILVAAGLMALWILQIVVAVGVPDGKLRWILHILVFLVSVSLLGSGIKALSQANNTARDDFFDNLLP